MAQNSKPEPTDEGNTPEYLEIPLLLQKIVPNKKRTYKDCMHFINKYANELPQDVINSRILNCTRHNCIEEEDDINQSHVGFWDPRMRSLSPDDRREEVFIDYRLLKKNK